MNRLIVIGFFILAGCSPEISVYTDSDPDYDLWSYQTFDWSEKINIEANKNPMYYNELNDKRIKTAIAGELKNRGYQISGNQPDILIHYHIVIQDRMEIVTEPYGYSYTPYWMHRRSAIIPYREGSLVIDMMDTRSKNLIWRGWAVAPIDRRYTSEESAELIKLAVAKIFRKFPGKAKSPAISKGSR